MPTLICFSEPKLTAAQRIVPEWKDYDAEIKNLINRVQDQEHEEETVERVVTETSENEIPSKSDSSQDGTKHTELWSFFVVIVLRLTHFVWLLGFGSKKINKDQANEIKSKSDGSEKYFCIVFQLNLFLSWWNAFN